jgi:asparagine synthase (glutamine-hydrolysing)
MCGITGFVSGVGSPDSGCISGENGGTLVPRPDDSGEWVDEGSGVALGFRRLSILDLSPTGHQPMISADKRFVIVFNGEIYNAPDEREILRKEGFIFRGTSDTEVMLASMCQWGPVAAVERFNGMFAFGLWDRQEHCLWLGRDRIGIKPLYYGWAGETFLFASETKSILACPELEARIDRDALLLFMRYGYIPAPRSIYEAVRKLEPGLCCGFRIPIGDEEKICYWSARRIVGFRLARSPEMNTRLRRNWIVCFGPCEECCHVPLGISFGESIRPPSGAHAAQATQPEHSRSAFRRRIPKPLMPAVAPSTNRSHRVVCLLEDTIA